MRRLKGRLELYNQSAMGRTTIDPDLLEQVAQQAEARLTNALRQLYRLPLQGVHPTLSEYVELRCVCSIIPIHFQRQNVSDERGLGELACKESATLLEQIESGLIRLSGEVAVIPKPPNTYKTGQTLVRTRTPGAAESIKF